MANKEDIILSIGVLSYNKPKELKRLLLSILSQMESKAEIVISDNSTNDEVKLMIEKEFQNNFIRYFKNENNVGFDRNIMLVAERSRGKYVWLMGHDDSIENGAVKNLLKVLNNNPDISFLFINFFINDQGVNNPIFKLSKDKFFKDRNEVLEEVANVLGFMSATVFEREKMINADKKNIEKFVGSGFMNFYLVLHALSQKGRFYFLAYPYVRCYATPPEEAPNDEFLTFAVNFLNIAKYFKNDFSKKSLKHILAKNFGHIWRGVLVESVRGRDLPIKRLKVLFKFYWSFPEFWIALPFFIMPRFVNSFFYNLYKNLAKNEFLKQRLSNVPWF